MDPMPCYAMIQGNDTPSESELKRDLEKGNDYTKYQAMKRLIRAMLNGESYPSLLMTVMRFVMPVKDSNKLKKLLLIYWEVVPKHCPETGSLLHEMILVCDAYRRDLTHPNEYVRGATLRFLCRLKEPELLEPLMPPIRSCLEHRHQYVRRNAILAVFTIYKNYPFLIPDACDLMCSLLQKESDMSCRRNAFLMLIQVDPAKAIQFVSKNEHDLSSYGDVLQLIITELIIRTSRQFPEFKPMFLRLISTMIVSTTTGPSVKFEAANALLTLSNSPKAIKTAGKCLIDIGLKESDNNVKLIVIENLIKLKDVFGDRNVLQDLAIDIIPIMNSTDMLVTQKTLELVIALTNGRNIDNIIQILKHELVRPQGGLDKDIFEKKTHLTVKALHEIVTNRFTDQAPSVVEVLVGYLADAKQSSALEILETIKDVFVDKPECVDLMLPQVIEAFPLISIPSVLSGCCWILAEFSVGIPRLEFQIFDMLVNSLKEKDESPNDNEEKLAAANVVTVTTDGTYATQSALQSVDDDDSKHETFESLISEKGEFGLAIAVCSALTKLSIRLGEADRSMVALKTITILLERCLKKKEGKAIMTRDEFERVVLCLRLLTDPKIDGFAEMYAKRVCGQKKTRKSQITKAKITQVDEPLKFAGFLSADNKEIGFESPDELLRLAITGSADVDTEPDIHCLDCVHQLTGVSDPIYCECLLKVSSHLDIALNILLVNRTNETIQSLQVELFTVGDMKVTQRPASLNLAPKAVAKVVSHIKVHSTESAVIYGNLVYQLSSGTPVLVVLNEMRVDVVDFARPPITALSEDQFRKMWNQLEWENKIVVQTQQGLSMSAYLNNVLEVTKMRVLSCQEVNEKDDAGGFLAANLYGQSAFGEDVIANVSLGLCAAPNQTDNGRALPILNGHVKIRAKSQGMALTIGERITKTQLYYKEI